MSSQKIIRTSGLLATIFVAQLASADPTFYDLFKTHAYNQTSNSSPIDPSFYYSGSRIFTTVDGEVTSAHLTAPSGGTDRDLTGSNPTIAQPTYASEATMDAETPAGDYLFTINDGGAFDGATGSLTLPESTYADAVPYLTGTSFDALQNATAGNSIAVTWNSFTPVANANFNLVFFTVFDQTAGTFIFDQIYNDGAPGDTIDGSGLIAGHSYSYNLFFDPRYEVTHAGLGDATSIAGFDSVTFGDFRVAAVPEPATFLLLSPAFLLLRRRR